MHSAGAVAFSLRRWSWSETGRASRRCFEKNGKFQVSEPVDKNPSAAASRMMVRGMGLKTADVDGDVGDASAVAFTRKSFDALFFGRGAIPRTVCAGRRVRLVKKGQRISLLRAFIL